MTDTRDAHTAIKPLTDRRVLISGGTTGIGRAIAVLLASEGGRVFVCGLDPTHLADALERILEIARGPMEDNIVTRELIALSRDEEGQPDVLGMFLGGAGLAPD